MSAAILNRPTTLSAVRRVVTQRAISQLIGEPFERTAKRCHEISLKVVKSGILPVPARVARGTCHGVGGQHSWIVIGDDCYDPFALIIDPTLWSYDPSVRGIWFGRLANRVHRPHQAGSIWDYGRPYAQGGATITLTPTASLSTEARDFLDMLGPLDRAGWSTLVHAPVEGWPAGEIIAAIADTKALAPLVRIDLLGMLTDRNPGGLYLP